MMNTYKNVFANYKLVPRAKYRECNLPEVETKILCEQGLPELQFLNNIQDKIYLDNSDIQKHQFIYGYQPQLEDKFIVIGEDNGTLICMNSNYEIVCVDFAYENSLRFMNSNLECFLEFISIYFEYSNKIPDNNKDDGKALKIVKV